MFYTEYESVDNGEIVMNVEAVSSVMSAKVGATNNISNMGAINTNLLSQKTPQDSVNFKGRSN